MRTNVERAETIYSNIYLCRHHTVPRLEVSRREGEMAEEVESRKIYGRLFFFSDTSKFFANGNLT